MGNKEVLKKKLFYLSKMAQEEQWDYSGTDEKQILYNYLCYTYDRLKAENKIESLDDGTAMCFNTGLLTEHGADIYAYFIENKNQNAKEGQKWFLTGFKQRSDNEMRQFKKFPEIADYFTTPADFIYDKSLELSIDYDHIIDDNYERFVSVGLSDKYMINGLLENAVKRIIEKVKRNYKFIGWNTLQNGSGIFVSSTTKVSNNRTLYAIFELQANCYVRQNEEYKASMMYTKQNEQYKNGIVYVKHNGIYKEVSM